MLFAANPGAPTANLGYQPAAPETADTVTETRSFVHCEVPFALTATSNEAYDTLSNKSAELIVEVRPVTDEPEIVLPV